MLHRIHKLDDSVINKIAAGEIVDRPASVLKELLENASDAGASELVVELDEGGKVRLSVIDNGCGIAEHDIPLALTRHATSKIHGVDDLFEIKTMGFRGEALASIASVSRLSVKTHAQDAQAICVQSEGGSEPEITPWNGAVGTQIHVQDLFYNVPARARFLKSAQVEYGHCLELIHAFTLSNPQMKMTLKHNGKQTFIAEAVCGESKEWFGAEAVKKRAASVFGLATADKMLYVKKEGTYGRCEGLVAPPGVDRSNGKLIFSFLNKRWVRDPVLRYGLLRGYHSHLLKGRFPIAALWVSSDPGLVDVNVHPNKTELRFQYGKELQTIIAEGVREALRSTEWSEPTQRTKVIAETLLKQQPFSKKNTTAAEDAVREFPLAVPQPVHRGSSLESSSVLVNDPTRSQKLKTSFLPSTEEKSLHNQFPVTRTEPKAVEKSTEEHCAQESEPIESLKSTKIEKPQITKGQQEVQLSTHRNCEERKKPSAFKDQADSSEVDPVAFPQKTEIKPGFKSQPQPQASFEVGQPEKIQNDLPPVTRRQGAVSLFDDQPATIMKNTQKTQISWDKLQYLGTFAKCYLMFQDHEERFLCVDQHALHERILYEKLQADASLLRQSQRLIVPEVVELTALQVAQLEEFEQELKEMGFSIRFSGGRCIEVMNIPSILGQADLTSVFGDLAKSQGLDDLSVLAHHTLATIACHSAVRAGDELGEQQLQGLLAQAKDVDFFHNCPHGRRVLRWFTKKDVEGWFDRI
ncbi:MAG: DNA mismatch repair endonuclease MutL [Oligoflexales bacterium]